MKELNESNAVGIDLRQASHLNNEIIKAILELYFDFLKNRVTSPLLGSVFTSLPSFAQHVNVEIVHDLVSVLRDYVKVESERKNLNLSNLIKGLLCAF